MFLYDVTLYYFWVNNFSDNDINGSSYEPDEHPTKLIKKYFGLFNSVSLLISFVDKYVVVSRISSAWPVYNSSDAPEFIVSNTLFKLGFPKVSTFIFWLSLL
mgnify:CR=1 FL=1